CIAGILILMSGGNISKLSRFQFSAGDIWILAAALAFAIYTVMVRRKPKELSAVSFLFILFLLGTVFLLPAFLVDIQYEKPPEWSQVVIWSVLYLGLGASISAFLLWNHSIRILGPSRTALFGNLIPV